MDLLVVRYGITEVRETTRSSWTSARFVRMSSWMPSVKNSLSFSVLMLVNGRTAMDLSLSFGTAGAGDAVSAATFNGAAVDSGLRSSKTPAATATSTAAPAPHIHPGTVALDFFGDAPTSTG